MTIQENLFINTIAPGDIHKYFVLNQSMVKKNTVLFNQNSDSSGLFFILSGSIKISKIFHKEKTLKLAVSGDIIGIDSFTGGLKYSATAIVHDDAVVCFVSTKEINSIIKQYPYICCKFLMKLFKYLLTVEKGISLITLETVEENLKEVLTEISLETNSAQKPRISTQAIQKKYELQLIKPTTRCAKTNYFQLKIKQLICM